MRNILLSILFLFLFCFPAHSIEYKKGNWTATSCKSSNYCYAVGAYDAKGFEGSKVLVSFGVQFSKKNNAFKMYMLLKGLPKEFDFSSRKPKVIFLGGKEKKFPYYKYSDKSGRHEFFTDFLPESGSDIKNIISKIKSDKFVVLSIQYNNGKMWRSEKVRMPLNGSSFAIKKSFENGALKASYASISKSNGNRTVTCTKPMTVSQIRNSTAYLRKLVDKEFSFSINRCRNIAFSFKGKTRTGDYIEKKHSGKLHNLAVYLNPIWKQYTSFGLFDKNNRISEAYDTLASNDNKTKSGSAKWLVKYDNHIREILRLAGYKFDPNEKKRKKRLSYYGGMLKRPGLADLLRGYVRAAEAVGSSGGSRNYQCKVRCRIGGKNAGYISYPVFAGSFSDADHRAQNMADQACKASGYNSAAIELVGGASCK